MFQTIHKPCIMCKLYIVLCEAYPIFLGHFRAGNSTQTISHVYSWTHCLGSPLNDITSTPHCNIHLLMLHQLGGWKVSVLSVMILSFQYQIYVKMLFLIFFHFLVMHDLGYSEKIPWPSHNALFPGRYFGQVVTWVISDEGYLLY